MNDPLAVRAFEGFRDLHRDAKCLIGRYGPLCDAVRDRRSLDEFQHERRDAVGLLEAIDLRDVRMVQCGERLGLALEPGDAFGVRSHRLRQHLDRDLAIECRVRRPIHDAHAAGTDLFSDLI